MTFTGHSETITAVAHVGTPLSAPSLALVSIPSVSIPLTTCPPAHPRTGQWPLPYLQPGPHCPPVELHEAAAGGPILHHVTGLGGTCAL